MCLSFFPDIKIIMIIGQSIVTHKAVTLVSTPVKTSTKYDTCFTASKASNICIIMVSLASSLRLRVEVRVDNKCVTTSVITNIQILFCTCVNLTVRPVDHMVYFIISLW